RAPGAPHGGDAGRLAAPAPRRGERAQPARSQPAERPRRRARPVPRAQGDRMSKALHELGVAELAQAIADGKTSSTEATQHLLARAKQHEGLGAYLAFNEDASLAQARAADARIAAGERTPLLGVPIAHKDVFVTRDFPTTAGSKMLEGYRSPFDATVVARLAQQGAVTLGKLNCDEFAMGGSNQNSAYGPAHNPWDTDRVPGGSSGGTAVAVAARLLPAATGTDTGG